MFFTDKDDLQYFDCLPHRARFRQAQIEWKGLVLNGSETLGQPVLDLSHHVLEEVIADLYQPLEFLELVELKILSTNFLDLTGPWNWGRLLLRSGLQDSQRNLDLLDHLTGLPVSWIRWGQTKKLSPGDLMPLLALKNLSEYEPLWLAMNEATLSRSELRKAFDLLTDLLLLGYPCDQLMPSAQWLKSLQALRQPISQSRDQNAGLQDTWPRYVRVKPVRQGDRLMHNMQITFSDKQDLLQKLSRLQQQEERL